MKKFIEKFIENAETFPSNAALVSCRGYVMSYSEVNDHSARIYSYLKEKGIGKENFVMLYLSHDIAVVVAMLGVLKSGAAFTIVEKSNASERISFIQKDCKCNLVIDDNLFHKMLESEPLSGYEKTASHDACLAIYTSGSTGTPKGIIHEYGKLDQMIMASDATMSMCPDGDQTRFALVTPLDFAASVTEIVPRLYRRHCLFISPLETIKDTRAFERFFLENKITDTAMSASLLKTYRHISPYLKTILVTGEASNGLYLENVRLINKYAMSESLFTVATFEIDRHYEVTPAGKKSLGNADILILDEEGKQLQNGQIGEVCFQNEYFREYLNMPLQTEKVMSEGVFHSGDMGFIDIMGNLIISGRKDDMIKINGNRIEPAEIEATVKEVLGIETVIAKGFSESNHAYVVLYYLKAEAEDVFKTLDMDVFRAELSRRLPNYMIPTYYIGLDKFPLNANGKISKKEFPKPDIDSMRTDYIAPSNEMEQFLCERMEKVLGRRKIGRNDDFFLMGGDSLHTIDLVNECSGFSLKSADIYRLRTPAKIADYLSRISKTGKEDLDAKNRSAMNMEHELLPEQIYIIDHQFYNSTSDMWNIPFFIKLNPNTDFDRFKRAVMRALSAHPSFGTQMHFSKEGIPLQYYNPESYYDIPIIETTDAELDQIKKNFIKPFELCDSPLYMAEFYRTESEIYLFMQIHHLICGGTSLTILMQDIRKCYDDENCVLPPDYYYLYVQNFNHSRKNNFDLEEKRKYDALYQKYVDYDNWRGRLKEDHCSIKYLVGNLDIDIDIKRTPDTGNAFFLTVAAMAMAKFNEDNHVTLKWTYNNRDSSEKANMTGLLYCNLPIILDINENVSPESLLSEVRSQIDFGIANCVYPFTFIHEKVFSKAPIIIYQFNTGSFDSLADLMDGGGVLFNELKYSNVSFVMNIFADVNSDALAVEYHYSASNYDIPSVQRFHSLILESAQSLLKKA